MPTVSPYRRLVQLVLGCVVLGAGIALLLAARQGADGYTMLVSGVNISSGVAYWICNSVLGVAMVLVAWLLGVRPGPGTVVQPVLVGITVSVALPWTPTPESVVARWAEFGAGFLLLSLGVAAYLSVDLGAGPAEVLALAVDPPVPFRWSYGAFQLVTTAVGWSLGADLGLGTLIVILGIGPLVDRLIHWFTPPGVREIH